MSPRHQSMVVMVTLALGLNCNDTVSAQRGYNHFESVSGYTRPLPRPAFSPYAGHPADYRPINYPPADYRWGVYDEGHRPGPAPRDFYRPSSGYSEYGYGEPRSACRGGCADGRCAYSPVQRETPQVFPGQYQRSDGRLDKYVKDNIYGDPTIYHRDEPLRNMLRFMFP